jgi:hypothetical protein
MQLEKRHLKDPVELVVVTIVEDNSLILVAENLWDNMVVVVVVAVVLENNRVVLVRNNAHLYRLENPENIRHLILSRASIPLRAL